MTDNFFEQESDTVKQSLKLVDSLSESLKPATPITAIKVWAVAWIACSLAFGVIAIYMLGPFRSNAWQQFITYPRFATELIAGIGCIVTLGIIAMQSSIPGRNTKGLQALSATLLFSLILNHLIGLKFPTIQPSELGYRPHCVLELSLIAAPMFAVGGYMARKLFPVQPMKTALILGLAAGLIPALIMQVGCMYSAHHSLVHHIGPAFVFAIITSLSTGYYIRKKRSPK